MDWIQRDKINHKGIKEKVAKEAGNKYYKNPFYNKDGGCVQVDHKGVAHAMVKLIHSAPDIKIHPLIKKIMTLRLIGIAPDYQPLTLQRVALLLGMREFEVLRLEDEGKKAASEYMENVTFQEGINQFNAQKKGNKVKQMLNPQKRPEKGE